MIDFLYEIVHPFLFMMSRSRALLRYRQENEGEKITPLFCSGVPLPPPSLYYFSEVHPIIKAI